MIDSFYVQPSRQNYVVYSGGYVHQRGGGVFRSFRTFMAPVGRSALSGVKAIAKNKTVQKIAKKAATKGAEVLTGVAVDALQGRDIHESLKERSRNAALEALTGESNAGVSNKRKRKRKQKESKRLKQRKRSSPVYAVKAPPAKRQKRIFVTEDLF